MPLSPADLEHVRAELGSDTPPSDADLGVTYDRLVGTTPDPVNATIALWLERKLSDYLNQPESFAVPGQYSEANGANIRALEVKVARFNSTPGGIAVSRLRRRDRSRLFRGGDDLHILP